MRKLKATEFKRWELVDPSTVAALFDGCRRGIYVLHFENGERYVGQTTDVVTRYSTHRHGSKHHEPWTDIVALEFLEISKGKLDGPERETIGLHRSQCRLRNKTFNFGHSEPSALDTVVSTKVQRHWATGHPEYDVASFTATARREHGTTPKLLTKQRAQELLPDGRSISEAVVDELAQIVMHLIPNAVDTEARFWSISDYPSTGGGRFATLNVGRLELAVFPQGVLDAEVGTLTPSNGLMWFLNAEIGTFINEADRRPEDDPDDDTTLLLAEVDGMPVYLEYLPSYYSMPVDRIFMPLGAFGVNALPPEQKLGARRLAIHSMRTGSARVNARSYSSELTRLVYERISTSQQT